LAHAKHFFWLNNWRKKINQFFFFQLKVGAKTLGGHLMFVLWKAKRWMVARWLNEKIRWLFKHLLSKDWNQSFGWLLDVPCANVKGKALGGYLMLKHWIITLHYFSLNVGGKMLDSRSMLFFKHYECNKMGQSINTLFFEWGRKHVKWLVFFS
jgi:hypothetical protein